MSLGQLPLPRRQRDFPCQELAVGVERGDLPGPLGKGEPPLRIPGPEKRPGRLAIRRKAQGVQAKGPAQLASRPGGVLNGQGVPPRLHQRGGVVPAKGKEGRGS